MFMDIKKNIPWWLKIPAKIVLSRIPVSHATWRKLNIFSHASGSGYDYLYSSFKEAFEVSNIKNNFTMLELGPGESIATGIIAFYHGAEKSYLIDATSDATDNIIYYQDLVKFIKKYQDNINDIDNIHDVTELMELYNIKYLTNGIDSLKSLESGSIDYLWSQSVLEHIRKKEFIDLIKETRRLLKPDGVCFHRIDLKDHMAYAHNNLRFSEAIWESDFMANSGFYTNRILYSEMLDVFKKCNFKVTVTNVKKWNKLPTEKSKLHKSFRNISKEDLIISDFDVLLNPE